MPLHDIRDITAKKGLTFQRLRFTITADKRATVYMEEREFDERYGTTIVIATKAERLGQLARDILKALGLRAQYEKWKPTLADLEYRLDQTDQFNGLNFWFVDMLRTAVTMNNEVKVAQIKSIYEWIKSNEDWLYKKGEYANRPP